MNCSWHSARPSALLALAVATVGTAIQTDATAGKKPPPNKPVLEDPSGSDSGLDYFAQGGVVIDGRAYFTADQGCSKYWKGEEYPFGVVFDMQTFRKVRTLPFRDTYDSCPIVLDTRAGRRLFIAHEYKLQRTTAMDAATGEAVWTSPANQPGAYFFGYSWYSTDDGSKLLYAASQTGLHALSSEDGTEAWWHELKSCGGVTPCVDQRRGWVFYQADGKMMKLNATDGAVLKSVEVVHPNKTVSWNTVLVDDDHGCYIATYWFAFTDESGKTRQMEWNSAVRVYDADLNLVWERTKLPAAKKSTLTYADGKLVVGTGGHWGATYKGTDWKYIAAYAVESGDEVWRCDLSAIEYDGIINVPYAYGRFFAESWGKTGKLLRINGKTGALEQILDYGAAIGSCAPCLIADGKMFSGDLPRDGIIVTELAENSTAQWPGPFGDPQTNTYALPDEPGARLVPMREIGTADAADKD